MKQVLLIIGFLMCFVTMQAQHQKVAIVKDGAYEMVDTPATVESLTIGCEKAILPMRNPKTNEKVTVYITKNGKYFYIAKSAKGNLYRRYFTPAK